MGKRGWDNTSADVVCCVAFMVTRKLEMDFVSTQQVARHVSRVPIQADLRGARLEMRASRAMNVKSAICSNAS